MTRVRVDDRRDYRSAIDLRTSSLGPTFFYPKTVFLKRKVHGKLSAQPRVYCTESPADTNRPVPYAHGLSIETPGVSGGLVEKHA